MQIYFSIYSDTGYLKINLLVEAKVTNSEDLAF